MASASAEVEMVSVEGVEIAMGVETSKESLPVSNNSNNNHGIKKVLMVLPSYMPASLEEGSDGYKGIERSAVYTMRELVRRGIEVRVIAPPGSMVPRGGVLYHSWKEPHWNHSNPNDPKCADDEQIRKALIATVELMKKVAGKWHPDIVDCHIAHKEEVDGALAKLEVPHVVNFHGPTIDPKGVLQAIINRNPSLPVIAVSKLQSSFLKANYVGFVPNGLPENVIQFRSDDRNEGRQENKPFIMLGRFSPKKAFEVGIKLVQKIRSMEKEDRQLIAAGALLKDQNNELYWNSILKPEIDSNNFVEPRFDVTERNKSDFLAGKAALLALTKQTDDDWGIPYIEADGMHITEALAAGLPVICDKGVDPAKVPEPVGYRLENHSEGEFIKAWNHIQTIDREACRQHFLDKYEISVTVNERLDAYTKVVSEFKPAPTLTNTSEPDHLATE